MKTSKLAIHGGVPAVKNDLDLEFPGAYWYGSEEEEAVLRVARSKSPFRFYGPDLQSEVDKFEQAAKGYYGVKYALGVNSATGALMVSLAAMGVGPGDEIIVPGFMWTATVSAVVALGAVPVLCEIDDTFNIDVQDLQRKITGHTRVVIPVHMAGLPARMDRIIEVTKGKGIFILEDVAQANGGEYNSRKCGTWGDIGVFSLQLNKNITAGEGGLIVTNDEHLYNRAFAAHDLGYARVDGRLAIEDISTILWGQGRRMSEMTGALANCQLVKLDAITDHMRQSKARIKENLKDIKGISFRTIPDAAKDTGPFLITVYQTPEIARQFASSLVAEGVQGSQWIENYGMHNYFNMVNLVEKISVGTSGWPWNDPANLPLSRDYKRGALPQTDDLLSRSVITPVPSTLSREQEEQIIEAFVKTAEAYF